ncbi:MAG: hypothetical protein FWE05_08475 [Defluviitaleaceae bacterium]|nr:hypothetical protein [Defluviitaleaceae bacterium]
MLKQIRGFINKNGKTTMAIVMSLILLIGVVPFYVFASNEDEEVLYASDLDDLTVTDEDDDFTEDARDGVKKDKDIPEESNEEEKEETITEEENTESDEDLENLDDDDDDETEDEIELETCEATEEDCECEEEIEAEDEEKNTCEILCGEECECEECECIDTGLIIAPPVYTHPIVITFPEDLLYSESYFVDFESDFNLLNNVEAHMYNEFLEVFIVDDGGFNTNAVSPYNVFTVVYGVTHPMTGHVETRDRSIIVIIPFVPLVSGLPVTNELQLRTAINHVNAGDTEEIIIGSSFDINGSIVINGGREITLVSGGGNYTITMTGSTRHFHVENATLVLTDGVHLSGSNSAVNGGGVLIDNGTFVMEGGSISQNRNTRGGGVFATNGANFTMNGGIIYENHATGGGGVFITEGAHFIMHDGAVIEGNSASAIASTDTGDGGDGGGGGVALRRSGTSAENRFAGVFEMHGGIIRNNTVGGHPPFARGGGVEVNNGDFTMTGGVIEHNFVPMAGAGVNVWGLHEDTRFAISGNALIQSNGRLGNVSTNLGGGVMISSPDVDFTMNGGTIRDNDAIIGGGVSLAAAHFEMISGTISGNRANTFSPLVGTGGGISLAGRSTLTMRGGYIEDNFAGHIGAGVNITGFSTFYMHESAVIRRNGRNRLQGEGIEIVYMGGGVSVADESSTFEMHGGTIFDNHATIGAGLINGGTFEMRGGVIDRNVARHEGGGVFNTTSTTSRVNFYMMNGSITRNVAENGNGAGVYALDVDSFIMRGGAIHNNEAQNGNGGGIFIRNTRVVTLTGGNITSNRAEYGGGIFTDNWNNLNIGANVTFAGNSASQGFWLRTIDEEYSALYAPTQPSGYSVNEVRNIANANILTATISQSGIVGRPFEYLINNFDINVYVALPDIDFEFPDLHFGLYKINASNGFMIDQVLEIESGDDSFAYATAWTDNAFLIRYAPLGFTLSIAAEGADVGSTEANAINDAFANMLYIANGVGEVSLSSKALLFTDNNPNRIIWDAVKLSWEDLRDDFDTSVIIRTNINDIATILSGGMHTAPQAIMTWDLDVSAGTLGEL